MLVALWQTPCVGCGRPIVPGERMERAGQGWCHISCTLEQAEAAEAWLAAAVTAPACPRCWLVRSVDGSCGCEVPA